MKKLITLAAAALLWGQANAQVSCPGLHVCIPDTTSSSCLNAAAAATGGVGSWSSSNSAIATVSSTGSITGVSAGWATISYVVVYTETVKVNPLPVAAPYYDTMVCTGGNLNLYAGDTGEAPANTYSWTGPNSFSSTARTPVITGATTSANGIYTLTITAESCSRTYTLSATVHSSSFYTVSVNQTAPFTLVGQRVHTRTSSAFTLQAVTSPALPSSGTAYTWAGYVPGSSEYFAPTSGFPTNSVVGVYPYTVTVTHNGCSASVPDTIIVPPSTDCPPETYFTVNRYRQEKGLDTLSAAACSDCSTVQPYVTIIGNRLTTANIGRKTNYYIVGPEVKCEMDLLDSNVFYMAKDSRIIIDSNRSTTISHCHFFACTQWAGIIVKHGTTTSGHVNIINNTLIENANTTYNSGYVNQATAVRADRTISGSSYYSSGMQDIVNSDGVVYNKNSYSIYVAEYKPSIAIATPGTKLPFTIKNSVFINRELASKDNSATSAGNYPFSWPSAQNLKTVVSSGSIPQFATTTYKVAGVSGIGIGLKSVGTSSLVATGDDTTSAKYEYNKMIIGCQSSDMSYDSTNLLDSMFMGIVLQDANVSLYNNTIKQMTHTGAIMQGNTANRYYKVAFEGDSSDHTNNRFYFNNQNVELSSSGGSYEPWDFTFKNALVVKSGGAGYALKVATHNGHNEYVIENNFISNVVYGIKVANLNSPALPKGTTRIRKNYVVGRTSSGGTEVTYFAISVENGLNAPVSAGNGTITIDSNTIVGAINGIEAFSVQEKLYVKNNYVSVINYGGVNHGIFVQKAAGLLGMTKNKVSGKGYNCTGSAIAYRTDSAGRSGTPSDISCNLAMDISVGFEFRLGNFVQWTKNEMRRCNIGMNLNSPSYTFIGDQGNTCEPTDNRWTSGSCSGAPSCTGCGTFPDWTGTTYAIQSADDVNPSLSKIYLRDISTWAPPSIKGSPAYSFASGTLIDVSGCGSLPDPVYCGPEEEESRAAVTAPAIGGSNTMVSRFRSNMSLFPNPTEGTVTVAITDATDGPVKVRVMNALGVEVYNGNHTFANGQTDVHLQRMAPGMYTVQLTGSNGSVNTGKVVLVK